MGAPGTSISSTDSVPAKTFNFGGKRRHHTDVETAHCSVEEEKE